MARSVEKNSKRWPKIRAAWIENFETIRELGRKYKVSESAIRKRAKDEDWPQRGASECAPRAQKCAPERLRNETEQTLPEIISTGAEVDATDLRKYTRVTLEMLGRELRLISSNISILEQIIEDECAGDKNPKRRQFLMRAVSLSTRIQAARNLESALSINAEDGPGKKQQAKDKGKEVADGKSGWGDLLNPNASGRSGDRPN